MGGYLVNDKRCIKEAMDILKGLDLPLDSPWKYDSLFMTGKERERNMPNPQGNETRTNIERLANNEEVEKIIKGVIDHDKRYPINLSLLLPPKYLRYFYTMHFTDREQ